MRAGFNVIAPVVSCPLTSAPTTAQGNNKLVVPGIGSLVALARLSLPAAGGVDYIDELSLEPGPAAGNVNVWILKVQDWAGTPNAKAAWVRYTIDCQKNSYRISKMVMVDGAGGVLLNSEMGLSSSVGKGTPDALIAAAACKSRPAQKGTRFSSAAAAITDGRANTAAAKLAATTPSPTSPASPAAPPKVWPPTDPKSALGRGIALHRDRDFQPALAELLAATRADPKDAGAFAFLGDTYMWLGMKAEGQAALDTAIKLDPHALDALR
jgi:hypothetical protein